MAGENENYRSAGRLAGYPGVPSVTASVAATELRSVLMNKEKEQGLSPLVHSNPWETLRQFTAARIALGRTGSSLPTDELLRFGLAHAQARDAVHQPFDSQKLEPELYALGLETLTVASAAPDRATYLCRPDLGRKLSESSRQALLRLA